MIASLSIIFFGVVEPKPRYINVDCLTRMSDCGPAGRLLDQAGSDMNDGLGKAKEEAEKVLRKTDDEFTNAGRGVGHAMREIETEFCKLMTLGGSEDGSVSCNVNVGVGVSANGKETEYYTFDPSNPETKYKI